MTAASPLLSLTNMEWRNANRRSKNLLEATSTKDHGHRLKIARSNEIDQIGQAEDRFT